MKKAMLLILIIVLCLLFCSCDIVNTGIPENSNKGDSISLDTSSSVEELKNQKLGYRIIETKPFSDGLAWVVAENTSTNDRHWVCINTSGDIEFVLESKTIDGEPFEFKNDVSFYKNLDETYTIIYKNGNVICESKDSFDQITSYGGGYVAVYRYEESFDSAGYKSFILDSNGDIAFQVTNLLSSPPIWLHVGDGIFAYISYMGSRSYDYVFVNANDGNMFEIDDVVIPTNVIDQPLTFSDGVSLMEIGMGNMGDKPNLVYSDGSIKELDITDYYFYKYGDISDGGFVFTSYEYDRMKDVVVDVNYYDISSGKVNKIGDFGELVDYTRIEELHFDNGYMMLPLLGADGKNYFTIMDKSGNSLFKPKECENIKSLGYDRYLVNYTNNSVVINGKGETIFENNIHSNLLYNDGLSVNSYADNYIDTNGDLLFANDVLYED